MKKNKESIDDFDEDDMPCPCTQCKEWFDLSDGKPNPKKDNEVICATCADRLQVEVDIAEALEEQRLYNPYDVFTHPPEIYPSDKEGYKYLIHVVKWNTKSTRMTKLYARYDSRWIFKRVYGQRRVGHGEKMR